MILDVKKYKLGNITLEAQEMKLLLLLSDNKYHKTKECLKYCYLYSPVSITKIRDKINKKFNEKIITNRYRNGYKTDLQIEISY